MSLAFDMIVAVARNGVIGFNGDMPWHVPEDLKHFKQVTQGHPVIMGRKTWDSLPFRPLPKRTNVVMTRDPHWSADGAVTAQTVDQVTMRLQDMCPEASTAYVMGGATLYDLFYPYARHIWVTRLNIEPEGDTWFQLPEDSGFVLLESRNTVTSISGIQYTIEKWGRDVQLYNT